jgi:hypothetical protein
LLEVNGSAYALGRLLLMFHDISCKVHSFSGLYPASSLYFALNSAGKLPLPIFSCLAEPILIHVYLNRPELLSCNVFGGIETSYMQASR